MTKRKYSGDPLDMTYTPITERPELEKDAEDVIYATEPQGQGTETTENVPIPEPEDDQDKDDGPVRIPGQSTLSEFR